MMQILNCKPFKFSELMDYFFNIIIGTHISFFGILIIVKGVVKKLAVVGK